MASIRKEAVVHASPERIWDALRDVGAIHTRLARGFVTDTKLEGDTRVVTFSNGFVARERIVDVDDHARRVAYGVVDGRPTHHSASIQVFPEGAHSRVVWIADLLPNDLTSIISGMMDQGMEAMRRTLEAESRESSVVSTES